MNKFRNFIVIVVVILSTPFALYSQSIEFTFDNDFVVGSDEAYTGGMSLVYIGDELADIDDGIYKNYTKMMKSLFSTLTFREFNTKKINASVAISQIHITPRSIEKLEPIYNQSPYAGIANLDFSLFTREADVLEHYKISVGIIGKNAGTKTIQENIHRVIGSENPNGWHNQLGEKTTFGFAYLRGVRAHKSYFDSGNSLELFYSIYGEAGNAYIGGGAGVVMRYGKNVPKNYELMSGIYNPTQFNMLGTLEKTKGWGYSLDVGVSLNGIGDYYIYREGKKQGYDFYSPKTLLITKMGASLYMDNFTFSMTLFPIFAKENITKNTSWGRLDFGWNF